MDRRKLVLFVTCLSLAIMAWLFFSLSNSYLYKVQARVHFVDSPEKRAFHSLQSDTVILQIEGTGWQLLFPRLRVSPGSVDVNLSKLDTKDYVTFSEQLSWINGQFASRQKIISVEPDTLYFDFSSRSTKKVPVQLTFDVEYKKPYNASGPVKLVPAYVMVSGSPEDIAGITYWPTDSLKLSNVSSDVSAKVLLRHNQKENVSVYPSIVSAYIPVDEFTEKSVEVPLKVLNNGGYDIKLLPEKVKVTFLTALSNYSKADRESIDAVIDMDYWQNKGYARLQVKLLRLPGFCKLISIEPQVVDFIVK